jgi:hypothetical protein
MARAALRDDLYAEQAALTAEVLRAGANGRAPRERLDAWLAQQGDAVDRWLSVLSDIRNSGLVDLAQLSVAVREIRNLIHASAATESTEPAGETHVLSDWVDRYGESRRERRPRRRRAHARRHRRRRGDRRGRRRDPERARRRAVATRVLAVHGRRRPRGVRAGLGPRGSRRANHLAPSRRHTRDRAAGARRAVLPRGRSGRRGERGGRPRERDLRADARPARRRARRPARHRRLAPARVRRGARRRDGRGGGRRVPAAVLRPLPAGRLVHDGRRGRRRRACAPRARLRAHRRLRQLVRRHRGAGLPAAAPALGADADARQHVPPRRAGLRAFVRERATRAVGALRALAARSAHARGRSATWRRCSRACRGA